VAVTGLATKVKYKAFLKGVKLLVIPDEASALTVDLLGTARSAGIARVGDVVLATKSLKSVTGARSVTLKARRKLLGRKKKFSVRVQITATDAAGNQRTSTRTVRVTG
jgi:hypothetical protein